MLNILRKKKVMKRILWGLAIIIIPAFVLWGAGSAIRSKVQGKSYVGKISGKKVTFKKFIESQGGVRVQIMMNYFDQASTLNRILEDEPLVNKLAWERLIILDGAGERNISVSDSEVISYITNHPLFTRSGQFDKRFYTYILRNKLGMTERVFEEKVRENISILKLNGLILKDINVTDEEIKDVYRKEREKAKVSFVLVEKNKFKENLRVPEEDISSFFNENRDRFFLPETINVQYIAFKYEIPEEKEIAVGKLVEVFRGVQKNPKKIGEVAREKGLTLEETDFFAKGQIVPSIGWNLDFYNVAFGLKKGELGEPIIPEEEEGTCYILMVKDIMPGRERTFEESKDAIINMLKEQRASELSKENAELLYEKAESDGLTLEELARKNSLELKYTDFVARHEYIEGLGESYSMVEEAFKLKIGQISKPVPSRAGYLIIRPEEFLEVNEEEFEKEKEDYGDRVLAAKKTQVLDEWFKRISQKAELVIDLNRF